MRGRKGDAKGEAGEGGWSGDNNRWDRERRPQPFGWLERDLGWGGSLSPSTSHRWP